jgi:7-keto-8-aminopelargonate synthetase-like enzyme
MVDEAHGIGVFGRNGRGVCDHFGVTKDVDLIMGTFSKSFASLGGFMAASKEIIEYVKHTSRPFIFSASITPASVACARKSLELLKAEPERVQNLQEISAYMRKMLKDYGIKIIDAETPIIPIYTYEDERTFIACKMLLERGVYVNPVISPATPVGQSLLRTSYTATHTKEQMEYCAKQIKEVLDMLPFQDKELEKRVNG